jgi:3,4-dihydroxy 2-butanone 4-phosphate synthase/GTP cyclohydrolase II
MPFASIPEALEQFRAGRLLVVVDDEDRENEGDLTVAAELATPEAINFMAVHGRGLICLALSPELCKSLELAPISPRNTSRFGTAFCESIDARDGVTTGISAPDRAHTIRVAMGAGARPEDLARPGHIFPLRAREGGVLVRAGQTEAAVDLARIAGLRPGGVICEVMNEDGSMARVPQLEEFCARHGLLMISVAALIRYRFDNERFVRRQAEGSLRNEFGEFRTVSYVSTVDGETHLALLLGDVAGAGEVLVRMHSHCVYGDVLGSSDCDCGSLVRGALARIAREGRGVFVYMHQTGPGMDVERGHMVPHRRDLAHYVMPDGRRLLQHETGIGAQILSDLGLRRIRLLTNHPRKIVGLDAFGVEVVGQEPLVL